MQQPQIAKYVTGEIGAWEGAQSDEEIVAAVRQTAYTGHHPCGTSRMGHDNDLARFLTASCAFAAFTGLEYATLRQCLGR